MTLRRVALPVMLVCAIFAAMAAAGYQKLHLDGGIGAKGERRPFSLTYEKLSKSQRLVNDAHFTKLPVSCHEPKSEESVAGELAAFNQPTEAWLVNRKKDIGGRKDFDRVWTGDGVPIEAPDGSQTRFRAKRAELSGEFRKHYRKASGQFSIKWQEVDEESGDVIYACSASAAWHAKSTKRSD